MNLGRFRSWLEALRAEDARQCLPGETFLGRKPDTERFTAPTRLAFPVFMTSEQMLRYHGRADWQHVDLKMQLFAAKLVEALRKRDIPMWVFAAFRTEEQQADAIRRGTSKARYPVAAHCQGKAVDIVHGKFMWDLTRQEWDYVGKIGKQVADRLGYQVTWGGDWSFYDPAHWELVGWKADIDRLEAGEPMRKTPRGILQELKGMA